MEKKVSTALKGCDKARTYAELSEAVTHHLRPVVEDVLQTPLKRSVRDDVTPDECCPAVVALRERLSEEPDDVWTFVYRCASALLERCCRKRSRESTPRHHAATVVTNCFTLFCTRKLPSLDHLSLRWNFLKAEKLRFEASDEYVHSNAAERRRLQLSSVLTVFSERAHKHFFTSVWMRCVEGASDAALHVHLLHCLATVVLPNLTNPVVLADYLSGCFSSGGLISVLALHGLFLLMIDHGLEYPDYYDQLYSLITADAFASRHRYDLFRLLDISLTSSRLPAYIAASVVKRVARVVLSAPVPTLYFALPFIRKVFQRHPNCLPLIHRSDREAILPDGVDKDDTSAAALEAKMEALRETALLFEGKDPYNAEAPLAESHALCSTLWELTALERHFLPVVPLMVSAFSSVAEDKTPLRFEKSYARLFTSEVTRPIHKDHLPTVAYTAPAAPADDDFVSI